MTYIICCAVFFSFGFIVGSILKSAVYDNQDWGVLKWDSKSMGFRHVQNGSFLMQGEKIIMAINIDSSKIPDGGIKYTKRQRGHYEVGS
jgi:hypothetical protein